MRWVMSFLISWRGVYVLLLFFWFSKAGFIGFYMPNHVFGVGLWALLSNFKRKWVTWMKLRIMIYHVPNKYKIFLSKGVLSPCNLRQRASSLPCEHTKIEWRPCMRRYAKGKGVRSGGCGPSSHFLMTVGGNEPLGGIYNWSRWKHGIRAWNLWWKWYKLENLLQSYVNFTLEFSWTFKVLKPTSFRGLCTLDPHQGRPPDPTRGP